MTQQPQQHQQTVTDGSIIISPSEVYAKVVMLTEAVTVIVERDKSDRESFQTLRGDVSDLKRRVDSLQTKVYVVAGFCAGLGALGGSMLPPIYGS